MSDQNQEDLEISYEIHIFPMFRPQDVLCMQGPPTGVEEPVLLASYEWLREKTNYDKVLGAVKSGYMPPDHPWSEAQVALLQAWAAGGFLP